MAKFMEAVLTTFIVLICLLLFIFLIETTFIQTPKLVDEIIKDPNKESLKDIVSSILSIGILVGMTLGLEAMVTRLMYFFNLDEFAESAKIKFKKRAKKDTNSQKEGLSKQTETKTVDSTKNTFKQNNQMVSNKLKNNKADKEAEAKMQKAMKPLFVKLFDALKGLKKDNVTSKTT
ncbi:UNVERIFIED_CONTAM: hypothetical protein O8I53_11465 [Campylobacter lari]